MSTDDFGPIRPGLHRDISKSDYLADSLCNVPTLNVSTAKLLHKLSAAHAWSQHPKGGRSSRPQTDSMRTGSLLDSLLLGGDNEIVSMPEKLPDAKGVMVPTNGEARLASAKAWKVEQEAAGRLVVPPGELSAARRAAEEITANLAAEGITLDGENQVTAVWVDDHDVTCRARFDHWKQDSAHIYDLKTVDCAHPEAVARKIDSYGWDIQAVAYTRAVERVHPELAGRVKFTFLFCEPEPPYAVLVRPLAGTYRALGTWKWERAVAKWAECLRTRKFPGYRGMTEGIEAPAWAMAAMDAGLAGGSEGAPF
jgi:hypothetical protein